jgi:hypothetical protein
MRACLLVAELPGFLQAFEVCCYSGIDWRAAWTTHCIQECVLGDGTLRRIQHGRANEPDGITVGTT